MLTHRHLHRRRVRLEGHLTRATRGAFRTRLMPLIFRLVLNIKSLLDQELLSIVNLARMVDLMLSSRTSAILILRSSLATSVH